MRKSADRLILIGREVVVEPEPLRQVSVAVQRRKHLPVLVFHRRVSVVVPVKRAGCRRRGRPGRLRKAAGGVVGRVRIGDDDPGDVASVRGGADGDAGELLGRGRTRGYPQDGDSPRASSRSPCGAWPSTTATMTASEPGGRLTGSPSAISPSAMTRSWAWPRSCRAARVSPAARSEAVACSSCCGPMTSVVGIPREEAKTASWGPTARAFRSEENESTATEPPSSALGPLRSRSTRPSWFSARRMLQAWMTPGSYSASSFAQPGASEGCPAATDATTGTPIASAMSSRVRSCRSPRPSASAVTAPASAPSSGTEHAGQSQIREQGRSGGVGGRGHQLGLQRPDRAVARNRDS